MGNRSRIVVCLSVLALFSAVSASSARADEIFNLALSGTPAAYGGSGTLTLNQAPSASGNTFYTGSPSLVLSLTIDPTNPVTFSGGCDAEYTNGALDSLYSCSLTSSVVGDSISNVYASASSGGYGGTFSTYTSNGGYVYGTFTIGPGVISSAPEPSSLLMLGVGLLAIMGIATYRRKELA